MIQHSNFQLKNEREARAIQIFVPVLSKWHTVQRGWVRGSGAVPDQEGAAGANPEGGDVEKAGGDGGG